MTLPSLPLPMIGALVLAWLALFTWRRGRHSPAFVALISLCAWQSAVMALNLHYGLTWLRPVRPFTAVMLPPLAWIALLSAGVRAVDRRDLWHLSPVAGLALAWLAQPMLVDAVIFAVFMGYGLAIVWAVRAGSDALPQTALQGGERAVLVWRLIGLALCLSALGEVVILMIFVLNVPHLLPWVIGGYSSAMLLAIGALSLSDTLSQSAEPDAPPITAEQQENDAQIMARLTALLDAEPLHRNPDLTLARLARRLSLPAKTLSAAINRATGDNVSRLINARRIHDACTRLENGANVTEAMLDAGFNTKSNFNREFRRVTGTSPSAWRSGDL